MRLVDHDSGQELERAEPRPVLFAMFILAAWETGKPATQALAGVAVAVGAPALVCSWSPPTMPTLRVIDGEGAMSPEAVAREKAMAEELARRQSAS